MIFFNKGNKNIENNLIKVSALLIHAAKIDENYSLDEEKIIKKTLLEIGANNENIDKITDDILKYREGCDVIMRKTGPKIFFGGTSTCECYVTWNGIKTYVQNEVMLSETEYQVTDKGLHSENRTKVWGSDYGAFKFVRQ